MQYSVLLAASLALFSQVSAKPLAASDSPSAIVKVYGEEGCVTATVLDDVSVFYQDEEKCQTLSEDKPAKSLFTKLLNPGCKPNQSLFVTTVQTFSDKVCSFDKHDVEERVCLSGDKVYGSFIVTCGPNAAKSQV
ncbi:hypothetical protein FSARC_4146 [Fusarium sarcochroum]|uniref:Uncharacterized protein n=1 Tax=Fusarium sarcochroum TaxID=1208366 RepID=A0A8H4U2H4_9HYPO|nr:hypothetical protein FSARC_4146 [Fusarium sarcochroum]